MTVIQKYGTGTAKFTRRGSTQQRVWIISRDNIDTAIIDIANSPLYMFGKRLICQSIDVRGVGKPETGEDGYYYYGQYELTAEFSTANIDGELPVESWEFGAEILEVGLGRRWYNAGTIAEVSQGILFPTLIRTITLTSSIVPAPYILSCLGKVNGGWFQGFPPETLLFEGGSTEQLWNLDNENPSAYRITYKFLYRSVSHNVVWRAPRQKLAADGSLEFDSNNNPVFVDGVAGTGNWDRLVPNLYDLADFSPLFFLPSSYDARASATSIATTEPVPISDINIKWLKTK